MRSGGKAAIRTAALSTLYWCTAVPPALSAINAAVIGWGVPEEKMTAKRKSFQMLVNCQITVTIKMGGDSGSMILREIRQKPAPSIRPALIRYARTFTQEL